MSALSFGITTAISMWDGTFSAVGFQLLRGKLGVFPAQSAKSQAGRPPKHPFCAGSGLMALLKQQCRAPLVKQLSDLSLSNDIPIRS